ncbi:MAG: AzlD domain-containing protein [Oscillospiraceae bacterium]|nr:AzlD domain-containing protein [Oscillospiraceae bacterium]
MSIYLYILAMAATTYLIRAIPLTLLKKPIRSRFLRSFLHYVPTACLTAMTFPAILYAADHMISGVVALLVGVLLALKKKSLIVVALASSATVFAAEQLIGFLCR